MQAGSLLHDISLLSCSLSQIQYGDPENTILLSERHRDTLHGIQFSTINHNKSYPQKPLLSPLNCIHFDPHLQLLLPPPPPLAQSRKKNKTAETEVSFYCSSHKLTSINDKHIGRIWWGLSKAVICGPGPYVPKVVTFGGHKMQMTCLLWIPGQGWYITLVRAKG